MIKELIRDFFQWMKGIDIMFHATGFAIILVFLAMAYVVMFQSVPQGNSEAFAHLRGMIDGAFVGGLVGYYFVQSKKQKIE
jgi:membrane associated rhomboid family serine protease